MTAITMTAIIAAITPKTPCHCIWEVTNVAVGPSAPPIIPIEEASFLQPPRHIARIIEVTKPTNLFIYGYPFVKFFNLLGLFKFSHKVLHQICTKIKPTFNAVLLDKLEFINLTQC